MSEEEYILLYEKFLAGKCSAEEQTILENIQDDFLEHFYKLDLTPEEEIKTRNQRIYKKLIFSVKSEKRRKIGRKFYFAACLAAGILISSYLFLRDNSGIQPSQEKVANKKHIIKDSVKAVLTLSDGNQVILDTIKSSFFSGDKSLQIFKKSDGNELVYSMSPLSGVEQHNLSYNSVRTLRGGEYQLVLSDGTKVWLNSESSLKFPIVFSNKERKVELSGEAYFEVAKNKAVPFKVFTKNLEVKVLGTQFNVNSYDNIIITLAEGSVELVSSENKTMLVPGERGELTADGDFKKSKANIEAALAWKNGYFFFEDESIKSIMQKISRWYNIEVQYKNQVRDKRIYGKVLRTESLPELLQNIALASEMKFKILNSEKDKNKSIVIVEL